MPTMSQLLKQDEERAEAEAHNVQAARRRLRSDPVNTWRASVERIGERVEACAANVKDLTAAFEGVSRDVARGEAGAEERQNELHNTLVNARNEHERAATAFAAAKSALAESEHAEQIVRTWEHEDAQRKAEVEARAIAARDVARLDAALKEFNEAHRAAVSSVLNVVGLLPWGRDSRPFDPVYALSVCYTEHLPLKWEPGRYDYIRRGFTNDPHSSAERPVIPGVVAALSAYT